MNDTQIMDNIITPEYNASCKDLIDFPAIWCRRRHDFFFWDSHMIIHVEQLIFEALGGSFNKKETHYPY